MAIEWPIVSKLQKAETAEQAREWLSLHATVRWLGGLSLAILLLPAVYMVFTVWRATGWVQVAFGCLILLGIIGATMSCVKLAQLEQDLSNQSVTLSREL